MSSTTTVDPLRHLRVERDRHVAFAFAAADLLIEVGTDDRIIAASGAVNAVLGVELRELIGRPFTTFITTADHAFVRRFLKQLRTAYRSDPTVVHIARADGGSNHIVLGGCRLPDRSASAFLSVALVPEGLVPETQERDEATGLLTADALRAAAQRGASAGAQLQLVRLDGLSGAARQLPAPRMALLMQEIGAALRANSVGGDTAGRLGDDAFGIVVKPGSDAGRNTALAADLADVIRDSGVPDGQVASHVIRLDVALGSLSNGDASRVLSYAMNSFARSIGGAFDISTLQGGLTAAVNEAANRFAETRRMLTAENFSIAYQPVVSLSSRSIHHYEALTRFADGSDTYETVVFSEDTGLIMEFDLLVCRRVVKALERGGDARVAVNLSGRSVQNADFRSGLVRTLEALGNARHRLLFELTESAAVGDGTEAVEFLRQLRRLGHAVCLDDFGAGAAAYNYLRRFDIDFVKIDGPFLKAAAGSGRERALIRSVSVLCSEIGCKVIGEMIEDEAMATLAATLGVGYGQGWLFGKPLPELPPPMGSARRKGASETWQ